MVNINIKGAIVDDSSGWLYGWFGLPCVYPKALSKALDKAGGDDVCLIINSNGGVCTAAFEMYTAIMEYEGNVTAHIINAMSAATIVACAADKTLMSDTAIYMIHNSQASANGDYRDLQIGADALREFNASIINAYVKKTGKSREELQSLMDNDTYMSPQRAIELKFADGYIFEEPLQKQADSKTVSATVVASGNPVITEDRANAIKQLLVYAAEHGDIEGISGESPDPNTALALKELILDSGIDFDNKPVAEPYAMQNPTNTIAAEASKNADSGKSGNGNPRADPDGQNNRIAPVQPKPKDNEENGVGADPDTQNHAEGGKPKMTLAELLKTDAEAESEYKAEIATAKEDGVKAERERMRSLDAISATVKAEALQEAKYGENPIDGPTLAYQAMVDGDKLAASYMEAAKADSKDSKAGEVGSEPKDNAEPKDESDELAAYVNQGKGGN